MAQDMSNQAKETQSHTPGPWHLYLGRAGVADGLGYIRPVDEDGREIAHHGDLLRSRDENLANGHLIASAPDLLQACKTFALWLEREETGYTKIAEHPRDGSEEGERHWHEWYQENLRICDLAQTQARAAIAKAEGRS